MIFVYVRIVEVFGDVWLNVGKVCECCVKICVCKFFVGEVHVAAFGNVQIECY